MKKQLKIKSLLLIISFFAGLSLTAQVTQDFESGSRETERGNCWQFWGMSVNGGSNAISGSHGARSSALSNSIGTYEVISPWVAVTTNTQASFKFSRTNTSSNNVRIQVVAIATDGTESVVWGPQPVNSGTQNGTFNITLTGTYQFKYEFLTGGGGSSRGLLDDIVIPGTYAADVSNNPGGNGNCGTLLASCPDADGDGVCDSEDDYPNDADLAYNNYYPDAGTNATYAFEDLWPSYGDYDFNDLIVDFQYNTVTNADNDAVKLEITCYARAVGASKQNGFGIVFENIAKSDIASVTGFVHAGGINVDGNGLESGQSKPVIILFEDVNDVINRPGGSLYNTIPGNPYGISDSVNITVTFTNPVDASLLTTSNYNPFIFVDGVRSHEIHAVNNPPTDLMDMTLFGQSNDDSDPSTGKYYKSSDNFCWAMEIPQRFSYPVEMADIVTSHLKFAEWSQSGGAQKNDWYQNNSGYRNGSNIY